MEAVAIYPRDLTHVIIIHFRRFGGSRNKILLGAMRDS